MNENLDLTKILKGCPVGTEFYHAGYGRVWLVCIDLHSAYPIQLSLNNGPYAHTSTTKKGTVNIQHEGECILFPSRTQRDWSKFERFWDKPKKERFDPNTLQPFDKVLVKDDYEIWQVEFFSHISQREPEGWCQCSGDRYYFCIPYNEETKNLIGTSEDCPDYYKWWEEKQL